MTYEERPLRRQKIRYGGSDAPLVFQAVKAGEKVTPTGEETISIYSPDGTLLVDAADIEASGTVFTYYVDARDTDDYPIAQGYRAEFVVNDAVDNNHRHIVFDVVKYPLPRDIGRDQLVALDDRLRSAEHAGDADFSAVIEACWDEIQGMLETKAIEDKQLMEDMILDVSRLSICARRYILAQIFDTKGFDAARDHNMAMFRGLFGSMLNGIKYDANQDGSEDSERAVVRSLRLIT